MKLLICLTSLLMASQAFATKARLQALGEDVADGTFYIDDDRAIFRNVSFIHRYKDNVFVEFGGNGNQLVEADAHNSPIRQGGLIKSMGNMVYGVWFGDDSNTQDLTRLSADTTAFGTGAANASKLNRQRNTLDLFVGGEAGVKWGVNLRRSVYDSTTSGGGLENYDKAYAVRLGVDGDAWEAYANVSVKGEAKYKNATTDLQYDGGHGYHLGGSYEMGSTRGFVSYKSAGWDAKDGTVTTEGGFTIMEAGVGHTMDLAGGKVFTSLRYNSIDVEMKYAAGTAEFNRMIVPIIVGYEKKVNDWLTLRGGINHKVIGNFEFKNGNSFTQWSRHLVMSAYGDATNSNAYTAPSITDGEFSYNKTTIVSLGNSLHLGKVRVDGVLATDVSPATGPNSNGKLNFNENLMTRISATYSF